MTRIRRLPESDLNWTNSVPRGGLPTHGAVKVALSNILVRVETLTSKHEWDLGELGDVDAVAGDGVPWQQTEATPSRDAQSPATCRQTSGVELADFLGLGLILNNQESQPRTGDF